MIDWFETKTVDALADSLCTEMIKRFPPAEFEDQRRKSPSRLQKTRDVLFLQVAAFVHSHSLNVFKKARLGNRFKWALREAGYPQEFVESFTYELIKFVTIESRRAAKATSQRS